MKLLVTDIERANAIQHDPPRRCKEHDLVDCANCFPIRKRTDYVELEVAARHKHPTYSCNALQKKAPAKFVQPGPGVSDKITTPSSSSSLPIISTPKTIDVLQAEPICRHNGISIAGKLICVECLRETINDPVQLAEAEHELFGVAILTICKRAANKHKLVSVSVPDCMMTAVLELVRPKNKKSILAAKNPEAMAYTIASRAIQKLYRPKSVVALAVGQMDFGSENSSDRDFSVTSRLDFLHGKMRFGTKQDAGGTPDSSLGRVGDSKLLGDEQTEWARHCYERARVFPGVKLLWNDENLGLLRIVLDESKKLLPEQPFSSWLVIDMKIGYTADMKQHTWAEIAKQVSPPWKPVTVDRVRYAYEQGLAAMKAHLLNKLLPVYENSNV